MKKSTAHKSYKEGQSGEYKIRVTQRNENMTAHQVVVEDHFEQEGMEISQIRVKYNGEDITKQCEIIIDENLRKFKIITGKDVSDKDELLVIYQTAFKKMITGDIKTAVILLIIYAICLVLKQVLQPKMMGDSYGNLSIDNNLFDLRWSEIRRIRRNVISPDPRNVCDQFISIRSV